ncbi:MAG: hypothetical protein Q3X95_02725, partial [Duodenibacillus sp.]|nr:hypothetical protein [Duodenibacillus sp.]
PGTVHGFSAAGRHFAKIAAPVVFEASSAAVLTKRFLSALARSRSFCTDAYGRRFRVRDLVRFYLRPLFCACLQAPLLDIS